MTGVVLNVSSSLGATLGLVMRYTYNDIILLHVVRYILTLCLQKGRTPLIYACLKGNERIVRLLIEKGANPQDVENVRTFLLYFLVTVS